MHMIIHWYLYMSSILLGMHLYRMHNGMDDRAAVSIEFYIPRATANNSKATMKFKINLKSRKNSKELKCISACLLVVFLILNPTAMERRIEEVFCYL